MNEKLPVVQPDINLSMISENQPQPYEDLIEKTLESMKAEQPALISSMDEFIQGMAANPVEAQKMTEVMVMTYRMLEAQLEDDIKSVELEFDDTRPSRGGHYEEEQ